MFEPGECKHDICGIRLSRMCLWGDRAGPGWGLPLAQLRSEAGETGTNNMFKSEQETIRMVSAGHSVARVTAVNRVGKQSMPMAN